MPQRVNKSVTIHLGDKAIDEWATI